MPEKGQWPPPQQGNGRAARCRCAWHSSCRLCATLQGGGLQEHCRPPSKLQPPSEATPKAGPRKVGCSRDQAYSAAASGLLLLLLQAAPTTAAPRLLRLHCPLHSVELCCTLLRARCRTLHCSARKVLGHCSQCQTRQRQESVACRRFSSEERLCWLCLLVCLALPCLTTTIDPL